MKFFGLLLAAVGLTPTAVAAEKPPVDPVTLALVDEGDVQPIKLHVRRLLDALDFLGNPLPAADRSALDAALDDPDDTRARAAIQRILDPHCLAGVSITPEARVSAVAGPAAPRLIADGWRQFLVKVENRAGVTAPLRIASEQALPLAESPPTKIADRWLDLGLFDERPMEKTLSGALLEYRILQLYSRDVGKRAAVLTFDTGQGTQDLGFRADVTLTFDCAKAPSLLLRVHDETGAATAAAFEIRDAQGRTYPSQAKRLPPDFFFQSQVYRYDGESIRLPPGPYTVSVTHGPEYLAQTLKVVMTRKPQVLDVRLKRWIDPARRGWWSGDHHIHASGCKHFSKPTQGVDPVVMVRHVRGEDLKVGAALTWGPGFDHQKQFFTGKEDANSRYPYLLRYDVEVSGFGSEKSGHLVLLGLKDQHYPGGDSTAHWPTLGLNTLKWAQRQGAVCGPAHSGWGLGVASADLPNYEMPAFDGIGANEYIVDVTHNVPGPDGKLVPAVDFLSTADTPFVWELNVWYHTLNAGFRTRVSGETDFPCIYGERVGLGRSYVGIDGKLTYAKWIQGIELGRAYVGDGRSHILDFQVNQVSVGRAGSQVELPAPATVRVKANIAAYLPEKPDTTILAYKPLMAGLAGKRFSHETEALKPYWHVERSRIENTRNVRVEVVVNGRPVAETALLADGAVRPIAFDVPLKNSSWIALRLLGSAHSNPIFVRVGDREVCASRRSVDWLLRGVDQLWSQKERHIRAEEKPDAIAAYDHARKTYRHLRDLCTPD